MFETPLAKVAGILAVTAAAVFAIQLYSAPRPGDAPVVLELFTSQGCSSCPPADELLRTLANDASLRGHVIPLAFHVDYWNSLGWRDPFSAHEWSQRQGDYVRALHAASAYTPQMVVDGARQFVGSSSFEIRRAIGEESHRAIAGTIALTRDKDGVVVRASSPHANTDVIVVAYENGATTNVTRGENGGRTLRNDGIVRTLVRAATLDGTRAAETRVAIEPQYEVAAFLQDRATKKIDAAASLGAARH
ncbi:MAG: DUF1223 domain-containing protein [Acidobacteria bacterium]|nr:DUF1223 domain-containing protein [Acidobacteriota bacterium]